MPRRKQMTLIELLVIVAIVGILAAVMLPAMQQARRGEAVATTGAEDAEPAGQLNTIEVSELSRETAPKKPADASRLVSEAFPVVVAVVIALVMIQAARQKQRRAQQ